MEINGKIEPGKYLAYLLENVLELLELGTEENICATSETHPVIAYIKLNPEAINLDLPLLPEFNKCQELNENKLFTLEDIRYIVQHTVGQYETTKKVDISLILERLQQSKLPKEFIPEIINRCCGRCDGINDLCVSDSICDKHNKIGCEDCFGIINNTLKTIDTPQGKQIVGKWIF